jgi:hypothetical protein
MQKERLNEAFNSGISGDLENRLEKAKEIMNSEHGSISRAEARQILSKTEEYKFKSN